MSDSNYVFEGRAKIVVDKGVFYNKMAKFSRSVGIAVLGGESRRRGDDLLVVDALAATGVRGIRYYLESEGVEKVIFNDRSVSAYNNIFKNLRLNHIDDYELYRFDANVLLNIFGEGVFDFVDIDPFGTPSPFIDSSVYSVKNDGILAITATDLTALCGIYPRSAFRKYMSVVYKTSFCHEVGLRILIYNILVSAGRHSKIAYPLISYFSEQYARVYMRIVRGKLAYPYKDIGYLVLDGDIEVVPLFNLKDGIDIGGRVIGPLWIGSLHDVSFLKYMVDAKSYEYICDDVDKRRLERLLGIFLDEADMPPYNYSIHHLSRMVGISPPPIKYVFEKLRDMGYRVARTHFSGFSIKTDASLSVLLDVLRGLG
jgi:tRNA (guanine26-N2/guanine27-N2)-dimethyltransferase